MEFSLAANSQGYFPNLQLPKSVLAGALSPLAYPSHSARPPIAASGKLLLVKLDIWEDATWDIVSWEVTFGKCLW